MQRPGPRRRAHLLGFVAAALLAPRRCGGRSWVPRRARIRRWPAGWTSRAALGGAIQEAAATESRWLPGGTVILHTLPLQ